MHIHRHFVGNTLRNFNYVVACPETKSAIAIDPLDHAVIIDLLSLNDYKLIGIINTHEHADHVDGNIPLLAYQSAPVYAHHQATQVPGFSHGLTADDQINIGSYKLIVMDTPGHTHSHVCLYFPGNESQPPSVFSGDTIFNAGVGNCYSGDVTALFHSSQRLLKQLPDETRLYPGHDYVENNCRYARSRDPDNPMIESILQKIDDGELVTSEMTQSWETEKQTNPFFRLHHNSIRRRLAQEKWLEDESATNQAVFIALRKCRDQW